MCSSQSCEAREKGAENRFLTSYTITARSSITVSDVIKVVLFAADVTLVAHQIVFILSFIEVIAEDDDHSDRTVAACAGLLG